LLHLATLMVSRFKMFSKPPRLVRVSGVKQLDYGAGSVNAPGSIDARPKAKSKIVRRHSFSIAAAGHFK
jgi:hypothetical protein